MHRYRGLQFPDLACFLQPDLLLGFCGFVLARRATTFLVLSVAKKVVAFLRGEGCIDASTPSELTAAVTRYEEWIGVLSSQMAMHVEQVRNRAMQDPPAQLTTEEIRKFVMRLEQLRRAALHAIRVEPYCRRTAIGAARALLGCCSFGYLPPLRVSLLASLLLPDSPPRCMHANCTAPAACMGNRLSRKGDGVGLRYGVHFAHHKNELVWGGLAIAFEMPAELTNLLEYHATIGHSLLTSPHGMDEEPFVFVSEYDGRPMGPKTISYWLKGLMESLVGASITPQRLRHLFVTDRRERGGEGPSDRGAAYLMGNSVLQWDRVYDVNFGQREAQGAVEAMAAWRQGLLAPEGGTA